MTRAFLILAAVAGLGAAVAGCGKMGDLERPAPLWGEKAKADYQAQQRAAAAAKATNAADNQPEPLPSLDEPAANDAAGPPPP